MNVADRLWESMVAEVKDHHQDQKCHDDCVYNEYLLGAMLFLARAVIARATYDKGGESFQIQTLEIGKEEVGWIMIHINNLLKIVHLQILHEKLGTGDPWGLPVGRFLADVFGQDSPGGD